MTPEQERNHWILAGYPLMPEWIEFCRGYAIVTGSHDETLLNINTLTSQWWDAVKREYGRGQSELSISAYFTNSASTDPNGIDYVVTGVRYEYDLGDDHEGT